MTKQYRRSMFVSGNRDRNEKNITAVLDRYGVPYCHMPPSAGFDLLVIVSPVEFWEVKNPEVKWSLTRAEQERKSYCKAHGIQYRVIETMEQAVDAIVERKPK
jgi:hypothetical protein